MTLAWLVNCLTSHAFWVEMPGSFHHKRSSQWRVTGDNELILCIWYKFLNPFFFIIVIVVINHLFALSYTPLNSHDLGYCKFVTSLYFSCFFVYSEFVILWSPVVICHVRRQYSYHNYIYFLYTVALYTLPLQWPYLPGVSTYSLQTRGSTKFNTERCYEELLTNL